MPFIKNTAVKATELSWDAFPEPTPETDGWRPDPDSIPVAGKCPDPRLHKNALTERQKLAIKRERLLGVVKDDFATSVGVIPPTNSTYMATAPVGVGKWAVPAPRATGSSRAFAATINNDRDASQHSETSTSPTPAWARPLAHLLGESTPQLASLGRPLPVQVQNQPTARPSTSTPPHLRKKTKPVRPVAVGTGASSYEPDNLNKKNSVSAESEPMKAVPVTAPHYSFNLVHDPGKANVEPLKPGNELKLQKTLLESFIPKSCTSSPQQHRRYLDIKLISFMEDEMDTQKRTTRQELRNMGDDEFKKHLAQTTSMHKLTWEDEQKKDKNGEAGTTTSHVGFNQHA
ncbi:hypothetical protein EKO04_002922 [Ascochyta lentis]|uniref:Uncharacterized protein n=1 Tax=Ascochyta lentis TaxID=205686 RepID=A0A8H7J8Z3_9PLEO|nr:hypothetical protein EKO04_002922 [Ascochyta lentis]